MRPVRYAMIGTGTAAELLLAPAVAAVPTATLWSVVSRSIERAEQFAAEHRAESPTPAYRSLEACLADPELDAVIVATPDALHAEQALAAARAGKHVFCEKPLAPDADRAFRIWQAAAKAGVVHQCAFIHRFVPALRLAREIIQAGEIGEVLQFRSSYLMSTALEPDQPMSWRFDRVVAGTGAIGDLGSHHIDAERFHAECAAGIHLAKRPARLLRASGADIDHPTHPHLPETAYLKALVFALD